MSSLADLPYELIDLIFEIIPSIGLHVCKKYDAVAVVYLDHYSEVKHFFLQLSRKRDKRVYDILNKNSRKERITKRLISTKEIIAKVMYGHIKCPKHMYPEIKKANLLTAEDIKEAFSEGNDRLLDLVPEEIFEEIYDDYDFMIRDDLDNIDTLSKYFTKDTLSDIYV